MGDDQVELGRPEKDLRGLFWYWLTVGWAMNVHRFANTVKGIRARHRLINKRVGFIERLLYPRGH